MNVSSLEEAVVSRAHGSLRARIVDAVAPLRDLLGKVGPPRRNQELRAIVDRLESDLFTELKAGVETEALAAFVATYEEVAAIVNAARDKD